MHQNLAGKFFGIRNIVYNLNLFFLIEKKYMIWQDIEPRYFLFTEKSTFQGTLGSFRIISHEILNELPNNII